MAESYLRYFDDTSDEEEEPVKGYDIAKSINKFKGRDGVLSSDRVLSFVSHAAGLYSLYSKEVQDRYYQMKKEKLQMGSPPEVDVGYIQDEVSYQLKKVSHFAGGNWKCNSDNASIMNYVFSTIRDLVNKVLTHDGFQREYLNDSQRGKTQDFFLRKMREWNCDPFRVQNFYMNFKFPNPFGEKLKTLDVDPLVNRVNFDLTDTTESNFRVEFLASLRLHNRSEKRHVKNRQQSNDTVFKIFEGTEVLINNKRLENSSKRVDVIVMDNVYGTYQQILEQQKVEELNALWEARINIKKWPGDHEDPSQAILSLWYLLFGCEVIRNPASLIHHNMAFDLIESKNGEVTEEEIMDLLPMKTIGSVQRANRVNKEYNSFMPHEYSYQEVDDASVTSDCLIQREASVTRKWLELKLGKSVSDYLISRCMDDEKAVEAIWKLIVEESFEEWGLP